MKKTETLAVRLQAEEKAEVEKLAESLGLLPADIIRQALRAVLIASYENKGRVELPLRIRTKQDDRLIDDVAAQLCGLALGAAIGEGATPETKDLSNKILKVVQSNLIFLGADLCVFSDAINRIHEKPTK